MKLLLILVFLIQAPATLADLLPPPPEMISNTLVAQGEMNMLRPGQHLRLVNFERNFTNWYHEVIPVDVNNQPTLGSSLRVSQDYILQEISRQTNGRLEFIDGFSGQSVLVGEAQRYVIVSSRNRGWKTYSVQFLDEDGRSVDHRGFSVSAAHLYTISQSSLDADYLATPVRQFYQVEKIVTGKTQMIGPTCELSEKRGSHLPSFGEPGYYFESNTVIPESENPYVYFLRNRRRFKRMSLQACHDDKTRLENEVLYLKNPELARMSLPQRANELLKKARSAFSDMKIAAGNRNQRSSEGRVADFRNGHYIDPAVTPELAACISYHETNGRLNPYSVNYTICSRGRMASTAHGLGQITESVIRNFRDNSQENHLPLETQGATRYIGLDDTEFHRQLSGDIPMQYEVIMRILSANAKLARVNGPSKRNDAILREAVLEYDRDSASKYLSNVLERCLPCFQRGGGGAECYASLR